MFDKILIDRQRFDLLIIGYMGHSALHNHLIGSITDRLVELAPCQFSSSNDCHARPAWR
ncbi:universal stress protein [Rhizobium jaguaris]|uniref:Universal stress protein n=1 Tax=Rhizobium jaguaris TaxID=1312183 RepID=A0A387G0S4_9HYPH|nr:universal stress protein [Rhizobium jaguaris]AYG62985.1 universal stress protein [Rhizobium jaguaris]